MVIINTKAVEVSIQAVSPELILSVPINVGSVGAGAAVAASAAAGVAASAAVEAAGACAADGVVAGASSAHAAGTENASMPRTTNRDSLVINANPPKVLDCVSVAFTRANSHDLRKIKDKDLSVAHLAGLGGIDNCLDYLVSQGILDGYFNF